jgi:hypothetical protein
MSEKKGYDAKGKVTNLGPESGVSIAREFSLEGVDAAIIMRENGSIEAVLPAFGEHDTIAVGSPAFWGCVMMSLFSDDEWWTKARDTVGRKFTQDASPKENDLDDITVKIVPGAPSDGDG